MKRGRSRELIELRDRALIKRYYMLTEIQRLRIDDTLRLLSQLEFYISEHRILKIVTNKSHLIKEVKSNLTPKELRPVPLTLEQRQVLGLL